MDKINKSQLVFIVVGASGTGKTTLVDEMVRLGYCEKAITCTTRPMRVGEVDGVDYHFISKEKMFEMFENGELIEPPNNHTKYNYACPVSSLKSEKPVMVILDINGAKFVNNLLKDDENFKLVNICLDTPDLPVIISRFEKQQRRPEEIAERVKIFEIEKMWSSMLDFDLVLGQQKNMNMEDQINYFIDKVIRYIPPKVVNSSTNELIKFKKK